MDAYLAVVSKREVRSYAGRPIPDDVVTRILEAGRLAGSSRNAQPWRFFAIRDRATLDRLAEAVYAPGKLRGCQLAVAIVVAGKGPVTFDAGRAAQNMMLAAWNEGVGSCPNGLADSDAAVAALGGLEAEERISIVLSFGYPARPVEPQSRSAEEWVRRADRKPFDDVVRRL